MKYYTEIKTDSIETIQEYVVKNHISGKCLGFYSVNGKLRFFSNNDEDLKIFESDVIKTPETKINICCTRVRAMERQTPNQRKKRMGKLKKHLAEIGIEFKPDRQEQLPDFDYFLNIKSLSNKKSFRLYIKNTLKTEETKGRFSSYGLSLNGSTLPYFL